MVKTKKFLLVCDVEGTIFQANYRIGKSEYASSMWQPLAQELGKEAMEEETQSEHKWHTQGYPTYADWVRATTQIHQKHGLTKDTFDKVLHSAQYMPGVEEFFKQLDRDKFSTLLISGGFTNLINRAKEELGIEYGYGACLYTFDRSGKLLEPSIENTDFSEKLTLVKQTLDKIGGDYQYGWAFIGDGYNDLEVAGEAPIAFGINSHASLKAVPGIKEIGSFMEAMADINEWQQAFAEEEKNKAISKAAQPAEVTKSQERRERKASEKELLQQENVRLTQRVESLEHRLELQQSKRFAPFNAGQVIAFTEYIWNDFLYFADEAVADAERSTKCGYTAADYAYVYKALEDVGTWAQMKKGVLTNEEYRRKVTKDAISYALSDTDKNMAKGDKPSLNGQRYHVGKLLMEWHLRLKELPNCRDPRIYFAWDQNRQKVCIGRMLVHF